MGLGKEAGGSRGLARVGLGRVVLRWVRLGTRLRKVAVRPPRGPVQEEAFG